jgi:hypothetical protein
MLNALTGRDAIVVGDASLAANDSTSDGFNSPGSFNESVVADVG